MKTYRLTREDIDGRYVKDLPTDYGEMAKLDWLGYRGPVEMLAERFHMDEGLLQALNPGADFAAEGTSILVADTGAAPEGKVARIVVDKEKGELFAFDADDRILLAAPATIGSDDTPSPSGKMKVNGSAPDPTYEYNPDKNFQQGRNKEKLTIPAGPNGPVGAMWIDCRSRPTVSTARPNPPRSARPRATAACASPTGTPRRSPPSFSRRARRSNSSAEATRRGQARSGDTTANRAGRSFAGAIARPHERPIPFRLAGPA